MQSPKKSPSCLNRIGRSELLTVLKTEPEGMTAKNAWNLVTEKHPEFEELKASTVGVWLADLVANGKALIKYKAGARNNLYVAVSAMPLLGQALLMQSRGSGNG
jgi:hypothetical protein